MNFSGTGSHTSGDANLMLDSLTSHGRYIANGGDAVTWAYVVLSSGSDWDAYEMVLSSCSPVYSKGCFDFMNDFYGNMPDISGATDILVSYDRMDLR